MSLKAKLEAVIYAAEEPVTLAQFAGLFAEEALALREELAAAEAGEQPSEVAENATQEEESAAPAEQAPIELPEPPVEQADGTAESPDSESDAAPEDPAAAEAEAKRLARLRDREVREILRGVLEELTAEYANSDRGIEVREIAGGFRMATKPEYHDAVRGFVKSLKPPMKLSLQALETLAVVAYKQPITAPEISEIRGVDSAGVLGSLVSRKLITTAGRKQVIGRPILYKTTKEFLVRFGLKDVSELPSMEEFEKMAGELEDIETTEETQESELSLQGSVEQTEGSAEENNAEGIEAEIAGQNEEQESAEPSAEQSAPVEPTPAEAEPDAAGPSLQDEEPSE